MSCPEHVQEWLQYQENQMKPFSRAIRFQKDRLEKERKIVEHLQGCEAALDKAEQEYYQLLLNKSKTNA